MSSLCPPFDRLWAPPPLYRLLFTKIAVDFCDSHQAPSVVSTLSPFTNLPSSYLTAFIPYIRTMSTSVHRVPSVLPNHCLYLSPLRCSLLYCIFVAGLFHHRIYISRFQRFPTRFSFLWTSHRNSPLFTNWPTFLCNVTTFSCIFDAYIQSFPTYTFPDLSKPFTHSFPTFLSFVNCFTLSTNAFKSQELTASRITLRPS